MIRDRRRCRFDRATTEDRRADEDDTGERRETFYRLLSSASRLFLFAIPALLLSFRPGFDIKAVWYLSVGSQLLQACGNLLLLQRELHKKLRFEDGTEFIPASATAS